MRVAFVGKGGSGKTIIAALLAEYLRLANRPILAIDADINQTLGLTLGLSADRLSKLPILSSADGILKDYVRGTNPLIPTQDVMMKTSPPGPGSRLIQLHDSDPLLAHYTLRNGSLRFLRVGGFDDSDIGTHCFHAKTGAVEMLLNHMIDGPDDSIIVDMTAGADAFASGLFTRFDLTALIVEPTLQSVAVFRQYCDYARNDKLSIVAIGNKVNDDDDLNFLQAELGPSLLGAFTSSPFIRRRDKGHQEPLSMLEKDNIALLSLLDAYLRRQTRDWRHYWQQAIRYHRLNAESWANVMTGTDLGRQVDEDYLYRLSA